MVSSRLYSFLKIFILVSGVLTGGFWIHFQQQPESSLTRARNHNRLEPFLPAEIAVTRRFQSGDTLASVLSASGFKPYSIYQLSRQLRSQYDPREIRPNDIIRFLYTPGASHPHGIELQQGDRVIRAVYDGQSWNLQQKTIPSTTEKVTVVGTMERTFYDSALKAGLTPSQIIEVAEIFQYDIDFFADIRMGDRFVVIFEETRYRDGRIQRGHIIAARMYVRGHEYQAYRFASKESQDLYYDASGRPLRKMFLRAPLQYRRITSGFSYRRRHPITRRIRPHLAVDYAAAPGTPIVAVGSGVVTFAGWRSGYGRMIEIRHPNGYRSRYAHLRGFARGLRSGMKVHQGQVIGYVGSSGSSTGPHLHFEMWRYGRRINFLAMNIPPLEPLTGDELLRFKQSIAGYEKEMAQALKRLDDTPEDTKTRVSQSG